MVRPLIAALLIGGYIANQLAMVPHAHAAWDVEHGRVAHVHGSWLTSWFADDEHSHGCASHAHSHDSAPTSEHQHDCILVPDAVTGTLVANAAVTVPLADFVMPLVIAGDASLVPALASSWLQDRHELGGPQALYLTLRTLRI